MMVSFVEKTLLVLLGRTHGIRRERKSTSKNEHAIDKAAKNFERLRFCGGINERVLQASHLLPIEFRQVGPGSAPRCERG